MLRKNAPRKTMSNLWLRIAVPFLLLATLPNNAKASLLNVGQFFVQLEDDATASQEARLYLNHTKVAIAKVRKTEVGNALAPSETLIVADNLVVLAESLFTNGNYSEAIKCSNKARQIAIQQLESYTNVETAKKATTFLDESKTFIIETLQSDNTTLEYWLSQLN